MGGAAVSEWRVGTKVGRTLYRDDVLVGLMDSPELAAEVVAALRAVDRLLGPMPGVYSSPLPPQTELGSVTAWSCCGSTEPFHALGTCPPNPTPAEG